MRCAAIRCTTLHCAAVHYVCVGRATEPVADCTRLCALLLGRSGSGDAFNAELNNLTRASSSKVSASNEADSARLQPRV